MVKFDKWFFKLAKPPKKTFWDVIKKVNKKDIQHLGLLVNLGIFSSKRLKKNQLKQNKTELVKNYLLSLLDIISSFCNISHKKISKSKFLKGIITFGTRSFNITLNENIFVVDDTTGLFSKINKITVNDLSSLKQELSEDDIIYFIEILKGFKPLVKELNSNSQNYIILTSLLINHIPFSESTINYLK